MADVITYKRIRFLNMHHVVDIVMHNQDTSVTHISLYIYKLTCSMLLSSARNRFRADVCGYLRGGLEDSATGMNKKHGDTGSGIIIIVRLIDINFQTNLFNFATEAI